MFSYYRMWLALIFKNKMGKIQVMLLSVLLRKKSHRDRDLSFIDGTNTSTKYFHDDITISKISISHSSMFHPIERERRNILEKKLKKYSREEVEAWVSFVSYTILLKYKGKIYKNNPGHRRSQEVKPPPKPLKS